MQFWSNAPYSKSLARLHRINRSRVHSHLRAEVGQLVPPTESATVTAMIQAYMDGVWLEAAQSEQCDSKTARQDAGRVLDRLLRV